MRKHLEEVQGKAAEGAVIGMFIRQDSLRFTQPGWNENNKHIRWHAAS